jgi:phospholipase C
MRRLARFALTICAGTALLAGCAFRAAQDDMQPPIGSPGSMSQTVGSVSRDELRTIRNVIIIVQQNRSFENLFAGYPNADAPTTGLTSTGKRVRLLPISLEREEQQCVSGPEAFKTAYADGKMDGWNLIDAHDPLCPYTRVDRSETQRYWELAKRFALADHMFASTYYGDFTNQLYLIAGTTKLAPGTFDVLYPSAEPWGCDAPAGTHTSLLAHGQLEPMAGPFPCFEQFPTIANLLDSARVSWKAYFGAKNGERGLSSPFAAIKYVVDGPDRTRNLSYPAANVISDLKKDRLAAVSWVFSPLKDSDSPGNGGGPQWVNSIVTATQHSSYWSHSAIVVVWDDAVDGKFYDNAPPSQISEVGLGFRVPLIVISPYARRGYVSHTLYQFGSILRFIEENWSLGSLGATDERSRSIGDMFQLKVLLPIIP